MHTVVLPVNEKNAINKAFAHIQQGGLVAFPTDTVYGLGTSAFDQQAIDQLYAVKERDNAKAIPVLLGDLNALPSVSTEINALARRLAQRFWPGPLTLVVQRHSDLPTNLSLKPTIGVRMPDHPAALSLLNLVGPMAVTSANLSGGPNALTANEVFAQLSGRIALILDGGRTPGGSPSTVVDCTDLKPRILRAGPISLGQLSVFMD
jgi:L-threonylcarbamoyladenylate synthase